MTTYSEVCHLPRRRIDDLDPRAAWWLIWWRAQLTGVEADLKLEAFGWRVDPKRCEVVGATLLVDMAPYRRGDYMLCFEWPMVRRG
jgi:hypothetical protein